MLEVRIATAWDDAGPVALLVRPPPVDGAPAQGGTAPDRTAGDAGVPLEGVLDAPAAGVGGELRTEIGTFLADAEHTGAAGLLHTLPRPGRQPRRVLLVGVGAGTPADWRAAGAALARRARREERLPVVLPAGVSAEDVGSLAEGLLLASYRYRLGADPPDRAPRLAEVTLVRPDGPAGSEPARPAAAASGADAAGPAGPAGTGPAGPAEAVAQARAVAEATAFARDLTNTPSDRKSPRWFVDQVAERVWAAAGPGLSLRIRDRDELAAEGFGGILAVGDGSARPPHLLELAWRPPTPTGQPATGTGQPPTATGRPATGTGQPPTPTGRPATAVRHVVLIGKGITFDTGGLSIKPIEAMRLMRKDMGGAAAVVGAVFAAAALRLPVRVTALAPLAENAVSGSAYRPGDVVRHYGGATTEVLNTDAEGRIVLADALAYADRALAPDVVIDLATLTGAQSIALGKRTAALFSENDALADGLLAAAAQAGEKVWRLPLPDDYLEALASDVADLVNVTEIGAGAVMAALYLREFTGGARGRWAHLDMSSCAWSDGAEAELVKGATGWGVRTLVCWLRSQAAGGAACPDAAFAATAAARLDPAGQRPAAGPVTATHSVTAIHSVTATPDAMLAEGGLVTLGEHGRDAEAAGAYDVAVEHGADAGLASEG